MATFSISGLDVRSNEDALISTVKEARLQIVSALGDATLGYTYASGDPGSAEITLSNYNLLLNGTHLNDGPLPDRIELFEISWTDGADTKVSQLFNLAFESGGALRDCLFVISGDPLPEHTSPEGFAEFLDAARFDRCEDQTEQPILLDAIPGVAISGVVHQLLRQNGAILEEDHFQFFQPSDTESFDAFEYDAVLASDMEDLSPEANIVPPPEDQPEPVLPEPELGEFGV